MLSELAAVCDADDQSSSHRLQELLAAISREEEVQKRAAQVHIEAARKSAQEAKALSDTAMQAAAAALSAAKASEAVRVSVPVLAVFLHIYLSKPSLGKHTLHSYTFHCVQACQVTPAATATPALDPTSAAPVASGGAVCAGAAVGAGVAGFAEEKKTKLAEVREYFAIFTFCCRVYSRFIAV
jgi:hypothetical protein